MPTAYVMLEIVLRDHSSSFCPTDLRIKLIVVIGEKYLLFHSFSVLVYIVCNNLLSVCAISKSVWKCAGSSLSS